MAKKGIPAGILLAGAATGAGIALYFATRAKAAPPENIVVSDLIIEPSEIYVGKPVSIAVIVTNIGETKGSYEVTCEVV